MSNLPATPSDRQARLTALDPAASFIVQAPAGSGKTELITQRYLRLLSTVDYPEEILAITFTRKAAAEMRDRILQALAAAERPRPEVEHHARTWDLAVAALTRARQQHWGLTETPARLRIQTIDSLCAALTRQLPLLSELGASPATREDPSELYAAAAQRTLEALEHDLQQPLSIVLRHLDNDQAKLAALLTGLLGRREQWLRHLVSPNSRQDLERGLRHAMQRHLRTLCALCPGELVPELTALAHYAAQHLDGADHPFTAFAAQAALPGPEVDDLDAWCALATLVLTKNDPPSLRKTVNASLGFPPPSSERDPARKAGLQEAKQRFAALIEQLSHQPEFVAALAEARHLPPHRMTGQAWELLGALREILIRAAVELQVVFQEQAEVDFTEVHLRALQALGSRDTPTDLALALDYRIKHVLADEFQDTSSGQYQLLEALTAGWQRDDGRTLFVVGDPMQSIYGFREAEVGLYLRAREAGIGGIALHPLQLAANFRSDAGIVEWVNATFPKVLPRQPNASVGAVPYSASVAARGAADRPAVTLHGYAERDDLAEARLVCDLVRQSRQRHPHGTTVVLGRSRSHLLPIAAALRHAGVDFQALDLEPLGSHPVVQDLRSLTRALLHPADRLAWLSILRAPWCGLTLNDLLVVAGEGGDDTIWNRLRDPATDRQASNAGRLRVRRVTETLALALTQRRRLPLRQWLESVWRGLGGEAVLRNAADGAAAGAYFDLVEHLSLAGDLPDFAVLDQALQRLYAPADTTAPEHVQLMTMHKAKGLEFDTVILPGLGKAPRADDSPLLEWMELPDPDSDDLDLLLAPIKSPLDTGEPIYNYLRRLDKAKSRLENGRLLYVAATRAKRRLHLLGHAKQDPVSGEFQPLRNSLLDSLWPAVKDEFAVNTGGETPVAAMAESDPNRLQRLPADWLPPCPAPVPPPPTLEPTEAANAVDRIPFDWAGQTARHVGTLVHRCLERIVQEGLEHWDEARIDGSVRAYRTGLANLGVVDSELDAAAERCRAALRHTLADPRGRWILGAHREHRVEYALSRAGADGIEHYILDRTFVDDDGVRWIIDYKTSDHQGSDVDRFLDREVERYRRQLESYANLLRQIEHRPLRLGLYFPLLSGWREWQTDP